MHDGRDPEVIGHFSSSGEANLARNRLRDAGIAAELADDITADLNWDLVVAINNVKLIVPAEQLDEARAVLADKVTIAEVEYAARQTIENPDADDSPDELVNIRESNVKRAYFGAIAGLAFWPLQFYIFWILVKIYVSNEPLGSRDRRRAWIALEFNLPMVLIQCVLLRLLLGELLTE